MIFLGFHRSRHRVPLRLALLLALPTVIFLASSIDFRDLREAEVGEERLQQTAFDAASPSIHVLATAEPSRLDSGEDDESEDDFAFVRLAAGALRRESSSSLTGARELPAQCSLRADRPRAPPFRAAAHLS